MFSPDDTIVAIATPPGRGGIGVVRLSGPSSLPVAGILLGRRTPLEPRHATLARVRAADGDGRRALDEVVATYFPAPHSYTGEDVVEISAHGSPVVLQAIVRNGIEAGVRLAEPGEFTLRAFLHGKLDLVQAEAVVDLVDAATPLQARVAFDQLEGTLTRRIGEMDAALVDLIARLEASLDFPDEGYHFIEPDETARRIADVEDRLRILLKGARRGRMIREGTTVVICGRPNVGKSSIFNMLSGLDRAIVTPVAGTTRDLITERVDIGGFAVTLVDTAGWRDVADAVEREGVERAAKAWAVADLLVLVLDRAEPLTEEDEDLLARTVNRRRVVVMNKRDLPARTSVEAGTACVEVSARTGDGIDALRGEIVGALEGREPLRDTAAISNIRHIGLLEQAAARLAAAREVAGERAPEEFVLADLQGARQLLDEIVGVRTSDDLLQHIFERFCIGK